MLGTGSDSPAQSNESVCYWHSNRVDVFFEIFAKVLPSGLSGGRYGRRCRLLRGRKMVGIGHEQDRRESQQSAVLQLPKPTVEHGEVNLSLGPRSTVIVISSQCGAIDNSVGSPRFPESVKAKSAS